MILMGVDPGTIKAGYGIVKAEGSEITPVAFGLIKGKSRKKEDYPARLKSIYEGLLEVMSSFRPDSVVIESAFYQKNIMTAIRIGEGRGLAILAAAVSGIGITELPPAIVKKAVTGRGDASKDQVGAMVKVILGLDEIPTPDDIPDALACAIAGYHRAHGAEIHQS